MTETRWSTRLPALSIAEIVIPSESIWADFGDLYFRGYVTINGLAQQLGRMPSDREIADALGYAMVTTGATRGRVQGLRRAIERTQLDVIVAGLATDAHSLDRSSADVYGPSLIERNAA